jgi:SAM-dependent methyltransferase
VSWDIGVPQPVVVELEAAGGFAGAVLDVGCGVGGNSIFLGKRGYPTTGVDVAPTAIELARLAAAEADVAVEFTVADATNLGYENHFDTILDSALYHCFPPDRRPAYLAAITRAARPSARLHIVCMAEDENIDSSPPPYQIGEANLREVVGRDWRITELTRTRYTIAMTRAKLVEAVRRKLPDADLDSGPLAGLVTDDRDRLRVPAWRLSAVYD